MDQPASALTYPESRIVDQVDRYHGVAVSDPYRWLEADVRDDEDVRAWVDAQSRFARNYLDKLPERERVEGVLRSLWDYERFGVPLARGGRYFYYYNDGLMDQEQVLVQADLDAAPTVLFDPNTWSDDGSRSLAGFWPDPTGRYVAYLVQDGGSDWRTARLRDLATGKDLPDKLEWLKFTGLSWTADGSGFYYSRYPEAEDRFRAVNKNQAVYFHRVGQPQAADQLVHSDAEHPDWGFSAEVTDDGAYLLITVWLGTDDRYQLLIKELAGDAPPRYLIEGFEHDYQLIDNVGSRLLFRTNRDAPRGRVIAIDATSPQKVEELLPERDALLEGANRVGDRLVARYLVDAASRVELFELDGTPVRALALPGLGTAAGFSGTAASDETFYRFSSFNRPPTIYRLDVTGGTVSEFRGSSVEGVEGFEVSQSFFSSKDGTRVPLFVAHRKGLKLDGSHPTLLYGYGGFNIALTPEFSVTRLAWMKLGGVFAMANLRGGGEYGDAWHKAGTRLQKQNVFDDFIAAAEHLVAEGYTKPQHLAVMGGSNGGLLVGAVVNQRPDLFAAALPMVGVMDMLRFHRFTAGRFWVDDYGSVEDPEEFKALYAYSPYHNLAAQAYPAVLVNTADTDDRVVPGHSFKYAARLQALQQGLAPVLLRVETRAGHGAGTATTKLIDQYADNWAFLLQHLR